MHKLLAGTWCMLFVYSTIVGKRWCGMQGKCSSDRRASTSPIRGGDALRAARRETCTGRRLRQYDGPCRAEELLKEAPRLFGVGKLLSPALRYTSPRGLCFSGRSCTLSLDRVNVRVEKHPA